MVFLKTRPSVKWNNAEFTNLVSLHFLCAAHTLHRLAGHFFFPSPPPKIFFQFVYSEITGKSSSPVLFRPPWWCVLLWQLKIIRINSIRFWTTDIQDLPTSCRKFLYCTFLFVFSVLYTKNVLKRAQFSSELRKNKFLLSSEENWCWSAIYILHEFTVLDINIRLLYFHVCSPIFLPCVYNYCLMHRTYHSHKSFVLPHPFSGMMTALFSSACLPLPGHVECPC